jgi:hypothetical protein
VGNINPKPGCLVTPQAVRNGMSIFSPNFMPYSLTNSLPEVEMLDRVGRSQVTGRGNKLKAKLPNNTVCIFSPSLLGNVSLFFILYSLFCGHKFSQLF